MSTQTDQGYTVGMIMCGAVIGALLRYAVVELYTYLGATKFPYAVLTVNLLGCFIIGLTTASFKKQLIPNMPWQPLINIGFLGCLTTFSTYAINIINFFTKKTKWDVFKGIANLFLNTTFGIFLAWAGYQIIWLFAPESA